ncbi:MAG: hypothetical protein ACRDEA_10610 [Microcystaceae cyanobacterium]
MLNEIITIYAITDDLLKAITFGRASADSGSVPLGIGRATQTLNAHDEDCRTTDERRRNYYNGYVCCNVLWW